jgi:RHS repeat-associated protein
MVVNIGKFNNPLMYNYTYDQLNRITQLDVDSGFNQSTNTWNTTPTSISDYKERVAYDPNGNILKYLRNGTSTVNLAMDSLSYFYNRDANGRLLNNQLNYIRDEVSGTNENSNYTNDIDDQSANNYAYDSIGNLIKDNAESITNITWSVYGKILEIQRTATGTNPMTDLQYTYDAQGNRISKMVTNSSGPIVYTWYARDAQGNVMSTYTSSGTGAYDSLYSLSLSEQHIYGSTRLGILSRSTDMKASYIAPSFLTFQRGYKNYELSNHLGNVLVTISDKKLGVSSNGTTVDNYLADIRNANDYYPFGMLESGRNFTASNTYRYGFNGKENDNEVKGQGNWQNYGARLYDPRIGRFPSTDPLQKKFPALSVYQFSGNNPIATIDLDGLEPASVNKGTEALVIILQGYGGNPPDKNTQASKAGKINPKLGPDNQLGSIYSTGPKLQVVVYASSTSENTKNDVVETIKNFRSINPNGKVILVGHSQGGDNIVEIAKEHKDIKLDLIITLDIKDANHYGVFSVDDTHVPINVKNAINYYQEGKFIGGKEITVSDKSKTEYTNILSPGSNHRSIDNDQVDNVISDINNYLKGKDAVKMAKERVQISHNPADSESKDIVPGRQYSKKSLEGDNNPPPKPR